MPVHSLFLKYFYETCKTGSMRKAAKNLHVTSSSLSRKISETEKEIAVQLFFRSISGVTLTPAGVIMKEHVFEIFRAFNQVEKDLNINKEYIPQVTIAGPESVIPTFLPSVMSRFHSKHALIAIAFKGTSDIHVNKLIDDSHVDIILGFDLETPKHGYEISRCPLVVGAIVSPDHPLSRGNCVSFVECFKYPLILPDPSWPLRSQLDNAIDDEKSSPEIVAASNSVELIRTLIQQELGVGFATMIGVESELKSNDLVFIPIENPKPVTQEFVIIGKDGLTESDVGRDLVELLIGQLEIYQN